MTDLIIIGKGPAGISAALYALRANMKVTVVGKDIGSLAQAHAIENYYGLSTPLSGTELAQIGVNQAKTLGAEFLEEEVLDLDFNGQFVLKTKTTTLSSKALIMATGSARKKGNIPGMADYETKGISYCAVCDGFFYRGKDVAVLGSGEYALHEAKELLAITEHVTILTNGEPLKVEVPSEIKVIETPVKKLFGESHLEGLEFKDDSQLNVSGLFVALGSASAADFARKIGAAVDGSKINVDANMQTSVPGLFAAGDCTGGTLQVAVAVGEGAIAGLSAVKYIREQKK